MPILTYAQYLYYFIDEKLVHVEDPMKPLKSSQRNFPRWKSQQWKWIIFWTVIYILFMFILIIIYFPLIKKYGINGNVTIEYAMIVGHISAFLNLIQWFPQIVTTIRKKHSGSLSTVGVFIMIPGNFAQAIWLIANEQNFTTWTPLIVAGVQMIILFMLLLYYDYCKPKIQKIKTENEILQSEELESDVKDI